jgi:NADPH2:quinone reductase
MKALICSAFGLIESLSVQEVPEPVIGCNQVLVDVQSASVNFPDALIVQGLYQVKPELPFSPGLELSGIITEVGADVSTWKIGDRVMAVVEYGAFAEKCAVDANRLISLPENISFTLGAAFMLTYGTALHALKDRAKTSTSDIVLVLGAAGGVGIAAIQIAKQLGARVIAAASTDEKTALCRELGADQVINYTTESLGKCLKTLTDHRGVNVVVDSIGGERSEIALRNLGWQGRFLVVGFASGTVPQIPLNLALLKEREILGVYWGEAVKRNPSGHNENMRLLQTWLDDKCIMPFISDEVGLCDAAEVIKRIANREIRGKVVIHIAGQ